MAILIQLVAVAKNRVIGSQNALCWHLPEDLQRFKELTLGNIVIMGRKSWESLPPSVRPLPGRRNIVVTRQKDYQAPGAEVAFSPERALALLNVGETAFIIGGAELYAQTLPLADYVYLTEVALEPKGDAFYPELSVEWVELSRQSLVSSQGIPFSYVTYART